MDSDDNLFRDFFLDVHETLCYQRVEDARPRVCVPAVCREAVLRDTHGDNTLAGHPGIDQTTAAVSRAFYWPGLHADVAHFVHTCKTCATSKSSDSTSGDRNLFRNPYTTIHKLGHGFDWTNVTIQRWERVDRDMGGSYIQNNSSYRSSTQTYIC